MDIKNNTFINKPQDPSLPQVTIGLEQYFSNSIVPQLFLDTELQLIDFTPPIEEIFSIDQDDIGRSIFELKQKIGHQGLIGNIKGVLYTERNLVKHIHTSDGDKFMMNIQPCFSLGEEVVNGVIITFLN